MTTDDQSLPSLAQCSEMQSSLCLTLVVAVVFARSVADQVVCCRENEVCSTRESTPTEPAVFQCTNSLGVLGGLLFLSVLIIFALLAMATMQTLRLKSAQRSGAVPLMVRTISLDRREWPLLPCTSTCTVCLVCYINICALPFVCPCTPLCALIKSKLILSRFVAEFCMQLTKAYVAETSNSCNQIVIGATYLLKINLHLSNNIYQCSNEPLQHNV